MMISTRGRYALRVVIYLAENATENYIPMKDVASSQNISLKYLEQIIPILTKNGILEAVHGKGGGYKFIKDPSKTKAWDVLVLTENDLVPVACLADDAPPCEKLNQCKTIGLWRELNDAVKNCLQNVSITDLINGYKL